MYPAESPDSQLDNIAREEKVECPIQRDPSFSGPTGNLHQVIALANEPSRESGELAIEDFCDGFAAAERGHRSAS